MTVVWLSFHQQDPFGIAQFFGFQLFSLLKEYSAPSADFSGPCLLGRSKQIVIFATTSDLWYDILVLHCWEDFPLVLPTAGLILSLPSGTFLPYKLEKLAGATATMSSWRCPQMHLNWQILSCGYSFSVILFLKSSVTLTRSQISELLCFLLADFSVATS